MARAFTTRIKQLAILAAITVATCNVWTGGPLLALWVGSRVQGDGGPTMTAYGTVAVVFGLSTWVLLRILAALNATYCQLTGRQPAVRQHVPWLRSMRDERESTRSHDLSAVEIILIGSVLVVAALFEFWFFFYSSSPIDNRTGRS